jgi:hypothetical protein
MKTELEVKLAKVLAWAKDITELEAMTIFAAVDYVTFDLKEMPEGFGTKLWAKLKEGTK